MPEGNPGGYIDGPVDDRTAATSVPTPTIQDNRQNVSRLLAELVRRSQSQQG